jgi:hypothetical protein
MAGLIVNSFDNSILSRAIEGEMPLSDALQRAREKALQSLGGQRDLGLPSAELISIAERVVGHNSLSLEESSTSLQAQRKLLKQAGISYGSPVDVVVEPESAVERSSLASIIPVAFNGVYLPLVIPHERADKKGDEFRDKVEERVQDLFSTTTTQKVSEALDALSARQKKIRGWALAGSIAIAAGGFANVTLPYAYDSYLKFAASHAEAVAKAERERRSAMMEELYKTHAMLSIDPSKADQLLASVTAEHYDILASTLIDEPQSIETLGPVLRDLAKVELSIGRPIFGTNSSQGAQIYFDTLILRIIKDGRVETAREVAALLNEISHSAR